MNQQSQQKRTKFRQQIRKKQINQHFQSIRRKHRQWQQQSRKHQIDITQQKKQQIAIAVQNFIVRMIKNYQNKNIKNMLGDVQQMYGLVKKYSEYVSVCFDKEFKRYGEKVIDVQNKDISLRAIEEVMGIGESINMGIQEQISEQFYMEVIVKLLEISKQIKYSKFCLQSAILIIKVIWNALQIKIPQCSSNQQKNEQNQPNVATISYEKIINCICISLNSMLDSSNNQILQQHLTKLGLSKKINEIINISATFNLQTQKNLLRLVHLYNSTNSHINQNQSTAQKLDLGGITILSTQSTYKQKYVVYCIYFLKRQYRQLLDIALNTLNQLFQQNPYFIDSIKTDYYQLILYLILDKQRKINVSALNLINTITFYSQSASDQLVQQNAVLDYIYGRLVLQKQINSDTYTKKSIQKCTNIVCDLLLTRNQKLKRSMFKHHIWQFLYNCIEEGNKLFHTVIVFKFFFSSFSRKQRQQILPSYLQAVGKLSLQNQMIPEIKQIKQTLVNVFYHSMEHNSEQGHEQMIRLYQNYGLLKYMEDYQNRMV